MNSSSSPDTKSQQHWAAVNPLRCIPMSCYCALSVEVSEMTPSDMAQNLGQANTAGLGGSYQFSSQRPLRYWFSKLLPQKLDYCDFLLMWFPLWTLRPLQLIHYSSAELFFNLLIFQFLPVLHCWAHMRFQTTMGQPPFTRRCLSNAILYHAPTGTAQPDPSSLKIQDSLKSWVTGSFQDWRPIYWPST